MKKKFLITSIFVGIVSVFTLTSCQSKEEKIISRYEAICEEIAADDNFDEDDITRYSKEFQELQEDAKACEFTSEQEERLGKATGKLTAVMAKKMPGMLFNASGKLLKKVLNIANGFADGLSSDMEDINDAMEDVDNTINELLEE